MNLYLQCKTQQEIADEVNVDIRTIERFIANLRQNGKSAKMSDFKPFLYNLWNVSKINNKTNVFGNIPIEFIFTMQDSGGN